MWLDQISVMGRKSRPVQAPGKVVFVTEIFTRVSLFAGHQLKSRKSISWKPTITGCTAIPWIFWPGSKCKGLIWKNVAHVVIIKRTHGLGDREINNLCFRKNYLLCVGNRWHLFQWFVWGILSDYRQSRVGGLGGLGQTNRASYMPTEMDSPQNEILERDVVSWFHKSWESILKVCTFLNTFQW